MKQITDIEIGWLAGILEGEGSFCAGAPSAPRQPRIQLSSTDEDVTARVADMFGILYFACKPPSRSRKTPYSICLKGANAVQWMRRLFPLMGIRRQGQITKALSCYREPRPHKLTNMDVLAIRKRLADGETIVKVAADYPVSKSLIAQIKTGRKYRKVLQE